MLIFADSGQGRSHWQDAPGRLSSSLREGTDQHGELAVVEGAQRLEQPTADRDLFPLLREARRGTDASL